MRALIMAEEFLGRIRSAGTKERPFPGGAVDPVDIAVTGNQEVRIFPAEGSLGGKLQTHLLPERTELRGKLLQARPRSHPVRNNHPTLRVHGQAVDLFQLTGLLLTRLCRLTEPRQQRHLRSVDAVFPNLSVAIGHAQRVALDGKRPHLDQVGDGRGKPDPGFGIDTDLGMFVTDPDTVIRGHGNAAGQGNAGHLSLQCSSDLVVSQHPASQRIRHIETVLVHSHGNQRHPHHILILLRGPGGIVRIPVVNGDPVSRRSEVLNAGLRQIDLKDGKLDVGPVLDRSPAPSGDIGAGTIRLDGNGFQQGVGDYVTGVKIRPTRFRIPTLHIVSSLIPIVHRINPVLAIHRDSFNEERNVPETVGRLTRIADRAEVGVNTPIDHQLPMILSRRSRRAVVL